MSDVDPRVKLAYEESVRGLDMQSETLNELHSRTGVVIAAATVASAFLGAVALQRHLPEYWLNVNAKSRKLNNEKLRERFKLFRFACGALACDILFWLVAVGVR